MQLQRDCQALREMIPVFLCFLLVCSGEVLGHSVDDSVITNSPLHGTKYLRSVITNSKLTKCNVVRSGILESVSKASTLAYSVVNNSTVTGSVLNVTYADHVLDKTSTSVVFQNTERFFLNRVFDSKLVNATLDASPDCFKKKCGYNSSVYQSHIFNSKVRRSEVIQSNLTEGSALCLSVGRKLAAKNCALFNTVLESSVCKNSIIHNCNFKYVTIVNSSFANSDISGGSQAINVNIENSTITDQSQIVNSRVTNSKLKNCVIINSNIRDKTWDSVKAVNGMIFTNEKNSEQFPWEY